MSGIPGGTSGSGAQVRMALQVKGLVLSTARTCVASSGRTPWLDRRRSRSLLAGDMLHAVFCPGWPASTLSSSAAPTGAAEAGRASAEHLAKVSQLVEHVGPDPVAEFDTVLAATGAHATRAELGKMCQRLHAHIDPDGATPDPAAQFERRGLTALDALLKPPDELRTQAQRRADAVVEPARQQLALAPIPRIAEDQLE